MKYLTLLFYLLLPTLASADNRFEIAGNYCHTAHNPADDDDEIYFSNCVSAIWTPQVGGQRIANGNVIMTKGYPVHDLTHPVLSDLKFKGSDTVNSQSADYIVAANTPCVMVTANYDAANDDQNETVYVSNDWNLIYEWVGYDAETQIATLEATLSCRNGIQQ